jgi:rhodanese-related sulfurtransferase
MPRVIAALAGALLTSCLLAWAAPAGAEAEPFGRLTPDEVEKLLAEKDVRIFDVNNAEVFAKAHLPGAVRLELDQVVRSLPADPALRLIYYCKNGH